MQISEKEKLRLEAATRDFKCPICGNHQIYFSENAAVVPYFKGEDLGLQYPEMIPVAVGSCTCCGYIMDFNLGILMKGDDPR